LELERRKSHTKCWKNIWYISPIFILVTDVLAGLDTGMAETFDVSPMGYIALR